MGSQRADLLRKASLIIYDEVFALSFFRLL
jgi:hypothetical protein